MYDKANSLEFESREDSIQPGYSPSLFFVLTVTVHMKKVMILSYAMSAQQRPLLEPRHEKTNDLVSDLILHKPGCTATEDG